MTLAALNPQLLHDVAPLAAQFGTAKPFRHVQIEQFFTQAVAAQLLAHFPPFDTKRARNEAGEVGGKASVERIRALGPSFLALDDLLRSPELLELVGRITGIPNLLYDPYYFGGGTHENLHGQDLDPHIDFNRHPIEPWHRRLNLLVYLNEGWQSAWGGNLELHSDPRSPDNHIRTVIPSFNRALIFETTETSWHGFSKILLPDAERARSRKSIAVYFYSATRPPEELAATHSTIYVDRPLPEHLQAGHILTAQDVETLQLLIARRDQHGQRLYRDLTRLTAELEQCQALFKMSRLRRLAHMAKRFLGR